MKYAQIVMGPAGCGKSTYCYAMEQHFQNIGRSVHVMNLDPAAETFRYNPSLDIRNLITLDDVVEEYGYGPNGGLVYCLEYLADNLDWLESEINDYEDDYLILDCPGQIEIYTHFPIMKAIVQSLQRWGYNVCGIYLLDSVFIQDVAKYFAGCLTALSAMIQLEIPHINIMTKMDLIRGNIEKRKVKRFLKADTSLLVDEADSLIGHRFHSLNEALTSLIDDYNMINFVPLDITDESSISVVMRHVDNATQYGEHEEPKEPKELELENDAN